MTDLVVDSRVVIKWLTVEPLIPETLLILDGYQSGDLTMHAPDLINAEVGNVIWKKHLTQGVAIADAQQMIDGFRSLNLELTSTAELLAAAWGLAATYRRTVYDMLYVALSLQLGCPFVTADERLVNAIANRLPNVIWLAHWPQQPSSPPPQSLPPRE